MILLPPLLSDRPELLAVLIAAVASSREDAVVDVLSDVLHAVRLTGALYFDATARAPWMAATPAMSSIRDSVMPDFEHVIAFHIVLQGQCWVQLADDGESAIHLDAGDAVLFAGGDAHYMGSAPRQRPVADMSLYYRPLDQSLPFVMRELGGDGDAVQLACGYFGCDARPFNPVLHTLPRMLHVRRCAESDLTQTLMRLALQECERSRPGSESMLSRLSEMMFLQALRQHAEDLPAESRGWLAGLRDRLVGNVLRLMHARPALPWTLDTLAREVGSSRSALAERFTSVVGLPPMQYLCNWRLQLAARMIERGQLSIARVASEVGYESEAAFNRAFKRQLGLPPGAWRKARTDFALACVPGRGFGSLQSEGRRESAGAPVRWVQPQIP
jgi:AraC-like DNA-binding protein